MLDRPTARLWRWLETLYDPFRPVPDPAPPAAVRPFLEWIYRDAKGPLLAAIGCSVAIGLLEVGLIWGVGSLVDRALASSPERFFAENAWFLVGLALTIAVLRPAAILGQGAVNSLVVNPGLTPATFWRLHRHSLGQALGFFEEDFAGRLAQKQMQAGNAVSSLAVDVINAFGLLISFIIGMSLALGASDWRMAAATLLWAGLYFLVLRRLLPPIRAKSRARAERRAAVSGQFVDSFTNIATVKLFPAEVGAEPREERAARESISAYRTAAIEVGRSVMALRIALAALNAIVLLLMIGLGFWLWSIGIVSAGVAAAAGMLALRLTAMSNWIAFTALGVFTELGTLEDAIGTLSPAHKVTDRPGAIPTPERPGRVAFEDVSFRYGRDVGGVERLSLEIAPGENVGLVGPSGAGKSTLIRLLLRLNDVEDGRVALDGRDVRDLTQNTLRARIGVITQETSMFNRSAMENIRYGRPEASDAEVVAAAKRAQAHEFIEGLRDGRGRTGYEARLGERGVKLSGGQRQRIALARVFLKDAPIVILDEATSALDSEVEAEILDALYALMEGRTVIAVAHRLSTIAHMDRIATMAAGRVVETGTHAALLSAGGLYARLWARQSGGFLNLAAE
ncbi:MAG: ABC transporter ATP-binding protein [Pseudomonadota bacterium]